MKRLLLLLLCAYYTLQLGYSQKSKHQIGVGVDYNMYLSNPRNWRGAGKEFFYNNPTYSGIPLYPSVHYIYNNRWYLTAMHQYYNQIGRYRNEPGPNEFYLHERRMYNIDLLVGADILPFFKKGKVSKSKSSLVIQTGLKLIFPRSMYKFSIGRPDYHTIGFMYIDYGYYPSQKDIRFAFHVNYSYDVFKGLAVNANLNYGYIYVEGSPIIGQIGLRYRF
jgi:hypothetical protein